jgi:hypothetical protein
MRNDVSSGTASASRSQFACSAHASFVQLFPGKGSADGESKPTGRFCVQSRHAESAYIPSQN